MTSKVRSSGWPLRLSAGLAAGAAIVLVDNLALGGEVSPIVIVAMFFSATASAGAIWGRRAWVSAALAWVCVPSAHLIKHALGLPDTLHPNTYRSILYLALFSLAVALVGMGCGMLVHGPASKAAGDVSKTD